MLEKDARVEKKARESLRVVTFGESFCVLEDLELGLVIVDDRLKTQSQRRHCGRQNFTNALHVVVSIRANGKRFTKEPEEKEN